MNYIFIAATILSLLAFKATAQETNTNAGRTTDATGNQSVNTSGKSDTNVFKYVESEAQFPGGEDALLKYVASHVKYPKQARKKSIEGKVVVSFVINKEGILKDIKIIRGIGYGCDEEVIRVIQSMPSWKPGMQGGKPVSVQYTLPVAFALE